MLDAPALSAVTEKASIQDRIGVWVATLYQLAAVVIFALVPILAISWFQVPFMGVFVENTMLANGLGPRGNIAWEAHAEGLDTFGWQILSVDGQRVLTPAGLQTVLADHAVGDVVEVQARHVDLREERTLQVRLQAFPVFDQLFYFLIPFLIGLGYLLTSIWVFNLRRGEPAGRAFVLFSTSISVALATLFDSYTTNMLTYIWTAALFLSAGSLLMLALLYPREVGFVRRYPLARWLPMVPAPLLFFNALTALFNTDEPQAYLSVWRTGYIFIAVSVAAYIAWTVFRRYTAQSPIVREQARMILLGAVLAFLPISVWFILATLNPSVLFSPLLLIPLVLFPLANGYSILRYRFIHTDYVLSKGFLYALLSVLAVSAYVLLVWGVNLLFGLVLPADNPFLIGIMVFILAVLLDPLRDRLQRSIDAVFFRGQVIYQERLQQFGRLMTGSVELSQTIALIQDYLNESLQPEAVHVFLKDLQSRQYIAFSQEGNGRSSEIRFSDEGALAMYLEREKTSLFLGDLRAVPPALQPAAPRLALLGAQLFTPLPGAAGLLGWLALGPRRSGEPFSRRELAFVESLADQAALSIERARVVFDLQRRVHELNVLGRVAQGVNVTLNFGDILELIYAQTILVLPADHFRITLYDDQAGTYQHVFYQDGEERLPEKEQVVLPASLGLEQQVVRIQRPIVTEDYEQECRRRSVIPAERGLYAWIGVPLYTGTRTIGAISLGSRDPSVTYAPSQQNTLQAIADQAAGAIIKSRLLDESETRSFQLATLNQLARSLTSELALDPLLKHILESAVGIFNCEAGSLFLINDETGGLHPEMFVGGELPADQPPPGDDLARRAVELKTAIIDNEAIPNPDDGEQAAAFPIQTIMSAPMQIRDEILGAISVINKQDDLPFTPDDERLLTSFTAQAAIAVQNARLFTMTDQALAARVDELSVMQRIDRELNAGLDLGRAMQITLDWAMRQSGAAAGVVAVIEETGMAIKDSSGYPIDFETGGRDHFAKLPVVREAMARGEVIRSSPAGGSGRRETLLPAARSQIAIPIQREGQPIGLIFLESDTKQKFSDEASVFLNRLADHAAIAVANAQFYSEVQEANIAKSDFVSFVSHELKTPMTSIKGYTDLLAAGAVGEVNEAQAGFLATIRSNVNRMATLVSDLTDISRIEAGRLHLDYGPVGIAEVVDEVVRSAHRQVEEKGQQLVLDLPDDLPNVWGDRLRIVQILANLLSNANKYTPEGGTLVIKAGLRQEHGVGKANRMVQVEVSDNGIGIQPEDQQRIFTKFFRSEDQRAREVPGTGLGLNITKNLVEMQGGAIGFESAFREGTRFYFTLPIAEGG